MPATRCRIDCKKRKAQTSATSASTIAGMECNRCGHTGHVEAKCYAGSTVSGTPLSPRHRPSDIDHAAKRSKGFRPEFGFNQMAPMGPAFNPTAYAAAAAAATLAAQQNQLAFQQN